MQDLQAPQPAETSGTSSPTSVQKPSSRSSLRSAVSRSGDAVAYTFLIVLSCVIFGKTIFLGQPISHFNLMAEWDAIFASVRTGVSMSTEASTVLHYVPTYIYVAQQLHAGHVPLWNALNAFGTPLLGDIQSCFLSPFRLLFDCWPNLYLYNLELAALPAICSVGTFALARSLGANRLSSLFAALSYSYCPYFLWHLELLGVAYALNPVVAWLFRRAAKQGSLLSAILAGIAAGTIVVSSHPEESMFAIAAASLLMFCSTNWRKFIALLGVAGASAVCVSAPVLFPFVEFLKNSDCYKFGQGGMWNVPWQAFFYNLTAPGFGASSQFLGLLIAVCFPFAFCKRTLRRALPISAVWLAFLFVTCELWPLSLWCYTPPLSLLITIYSAPVLLLATAVIAGLGLESLADKVTSTRGSLRYPFAATGLVTAVTLAPWLVKLSHLSLAAATYDLMMPPMSFDSGAFKLALVCGALCLVSVWSLRGKQGSARNLSAVMVAISFASMCPLIASALPAGHPFSIPDSPAMTWLAQQGERMAACGAGVAKPDANLLYGVDEVGIINPMFPKRYLSFISSCGGSMPDATFTVLSDRLSKVIDLASVKYVLSQGAVECVEAPPPPETPIEGLPVPIVPGLVLTNGALWSDATNHQSGGRFEFAIDDLHKDHLLGNSYVVVSAIDLSARRIWSSEAISLKQIYANDDREYDFAFPVPLAGTMSGLKVCINVFDRSHGGFLLNDPLPVSLLPDGTSSNPHFRLLREIEGGIRLYQNMGALPRAYIVPEANFASSDKDALSQIKSAGFNPRQTVILEPASTDAPVGAPLAAPVSSTNVATDRLMALSVDRRNPSIVRTHYSTNFPGYLVLTDSFYPGWNAYIDGQKCAITRANYMFRAIPAPSGSHNVEFKYEPLTFAAGVAVCCFFWAGLGIALLTRRKRVF